MINMLDNVPQEEDKPIEGRDYSGKSNNTKDKKYYDEKNTITEMKEKFVIINKLKAHDLVTNLIGIIMLLVFIDLIANIFIGRSIDSISMGMEILKTVLFMLIGFLFGEREK